MCTNRESILDYKGLTPEQWQRERREILSRAHAARAQALRDMADTMVHPLQTILAGAASALLALAQAVAATVREWGRAYALRRERKAAARELNALDDRTLRDIGVSRSEIDWVVYGRDETRLRDASIAANDRQRCATATSGKPRQSTKSPIHKRAA